MRFRQLAAIRRLMNTFLVFKVFLVFFCAIDEVIHLSRKQIAFNPLL